MYCAYNEASHIYHFEPRCENSPRTFVWENYLLACGVFNSNFKRDQFARDPAGAPLLLDPTHPDPAQDPRKHLLFVPGTGAYSPKGNSAKAQPSIDPFSRPLPHAP